MPERAMYPKMYAEITDSKPGLFPDLFELTVKTTFRKSEINTGLLDTDTALQACAKLIHRVLAELVNEDAEVDDA